MHVKRQPALLGALAVLLLPVVVWAATSGPAKGSEAPLLNMDAINDSQGEYCVTCQAGLQPTVVAFVSKNDKATRDLMLAVNSQWKANRSKSLHGAIVIVNRSADAAKLKAFAQSQKLTVPTGVLGPAQGDMPDWKLNSAVPTTVVLVKRHKIVESAPNLAAAAVKGRVANLVK